MTQQLVEVVRNGDDLLLSRHAAYEYPAAAMLVDELTREYRARSRHLSLFREIHSLERIVLRRHQPTLPIARDVKRIRARRRAAAVRLSQARVCAIAPHVDLHTKRKPPPLRAAVQVRLDSRGARI